MASKLPLEIVSLIAQYTAHAQAPPHQKLVKASSLLGPYALVNKLWQAAFEAEIYSHLSILSPSECSGVIVGRETPRPKHGLTLKQLDILTSGPQEWRRRRRKAMRRVLYKVAVPHWLADCQVERRDEGFDYDDRIRKSNGEAFEKGIRALFHLLSNWSEQPRPLRLIVVLQAENVYAPGMEIEPGTYLSSLYNSSLGPYLADLGPACTLPTVGCISSLEFPNAATPAAMGQEDNISPRAALLISQACQGNALLKVHLNATRQIPENKIMQTSKRSQGIVHNLVKLPESVRVLVVTWQYFSATDVEPMLIPSAVFAQSDALSAALRLSSMQLRALRIENLPVTPEIFWPPSADLQTHTYWPRLERLQVEMVPLFIPSGDWVHYPYDANTHSPRTEAWRAQHWPNSHSYLALVESYFDILFERVGYAVSRMPMLKTLIFGFDRGLRDCELYISMRNGRRVLSFQSRYAPSLSVLNAWKLTRDQLTLRGERLEAEYATWPPQW